MLWQGNVKLHRKYTIFGFEHAWEMKCLHFPCEPHNFKIRTCASQWGCKFFHSERYTPATRAHCRNGNVNMPKTKITISKSHQTCQCGNVNISLMRFAIPKFEHASKNGNSKVSTTKLTSLKFKRFCKRKMLIPPLRNFQFGELHMHGERKC